eukprot:scaffold36297_cov63-Attheya_sp.AAC.3
MVSNILLIFGDVVGNNVLDQSLEGLEKISSAGWDIQTAMMQTRGFSGTKQETFTLYITTMDERVKMAATFLREARSKMTSSLATRGSLRAARVLVCLYGVSHSGAEMSLDNLCVSMHEHSTFITSFVPWELVAMSMRLMRVTRQFKNTAIITGLKVVFNLSVHHDIAQAFQG